MKDIELKKLWWYIYDNKKYNNTVFLIHISGTRTFIKYRGKTTLDTAMFYCPYIPL